MCGYRSIAKAVVALAVVTVTCLAPGEASAERLLAKAFQGGSSGIGSCVTTFGQDSGDQTTMARADLTCGDGFGSLALGATVEPGHLGFEASASAFTIFRAAGGSVDALYSDNFFFSSLDPTDTAVSIPVSLNLNVDGSLGVTDGGSTFIDFLITVFPGGSSRFDVSLDSAGESCGATGFVGSLCPANLHDASFVTQDFIVPLDSPVFIQLSLEAGAGANGPGSDAFLEFLNSFDFPTGRDLFNLPDGYTVNAPDSFVFDNRFLPQGAPTGLPEPATLAVLGLGVVGLGVIRRRKRHL